MRNRIFFVCALLLAVAVVVPMVMPDMAGAGRSRTPSKKRPQAPARGRSTPRPSPATWGSPAVSRSTWCWPSSGPSGWAGCFRPSVPSAVFWPVSATSRCSAWAPTPRRSRIRPRHSTSSSPTASECRTSGWWGSRPWSRASTTPSRSASSSLWASPWVRGPCWRPSWWSTPPWARSSSPSTRATSA